MFTLRYIPTPEHQIINPPMEMTEIPSKVSIALSGGIDSHYVLHVISALAPHLKEHRIGGICVDFEDSLHTDSELAKVIAEKYNVPLKVIKVDDPLADLQKLIEIVGEPRINLYQYYLYKESSPYLITGDGADELYLGYTFRYKKYLDNMNQCKTWQDRVKLYLQCHQNDWVTDQELLLPGFNWDKILEYFRQFFYSESHNVHPLYPVMMADLSGKLRYDFVPCNTKLSKSVGVEVIAPFLQEVEIRNALAIPITERYNYFTNIGKLPLRRMIDRMDTFKKGFSFDLVRYWIRKGFDIVNSKIHKDSRCFEYISRDWYNQHLSDTDVRYINKYLQIYALELYLEIVEKEPQIEMPILD